MSFLVDNLNKTLFPEILRLKDKIGKSIEMKTKYKRFVNVRTDAPETEGTEVLTFNTPNVNVLQAAGNKTFITGQNVETYTFAKRMGLNFVGEEFPNIDNFFRSRISYMVKQGQSLIASEVVSWVISTYLPDMITRNVLSILYLAEYEPYTPPAPGQPEVFRDALKTFDGYKKIINDLAADPKSNWSPITTANFDIQTESVDAITEFYEEMIRLEPAMNPDENEEPVQIIVSSNVLNAYRKLMRKDKSPAETTADWSKFYLNPNIELIGTSIFGANSKRIMAQSANQKSLLHSMNFNTSQPTFSFFENEMGGVKVRIWFHNMVHIDFIYSFFSNNLD